MKDRAYIVGVIGDLTQLAPWDEFVARCLTDLHRKGEVEDVLATLMEIKRRVMLNRASGEERCRVWIVIEDRGPIEAGKEGPKVEDLVAALAVTDVVLNECGRRVLNFWLGWIRPGENAAPMREADARMDAEAERLNCVGIQVSSNRPGYGQWIKRHGFEQRTVIYGRPIKRKGA